MRKIVKQIECPEEWQSISDFDSHRPLLLLSTQKINGFFFEFGMGEGSTELLKFFCTEGLMSIEPNDEWRNKYIEGYDKININVSAIDKQAISDFPAYKKGSHTVFADDTYPKMAFNFSIFKSNNTKVVFVDQAPAENRKQLIGEIKNDVDVIIVHDTEIGAEYVYGLSEILSTFKYRLDYQPEGKPHTTAVSNFIDVTKWI
jgi:hypothetical protein